MFDMRAGVGNHLLETRSDLDEVRPGGGGRRSDFSRHTPLPAIARSDGGQGPRGVHGAQTRESQTSRNNGMITTPRSDRGDGGHGTPFGYMQRSNSEDCLKCMLKVPHNKCQAHKYLRVGGGYRHSYLYVKAMLEELELQRQRELIIKQRLDAIQEKSVRAIKTYIRTKSGRLVERIIFMNDEDYQAFKAGGADAEDVIKKYLSNTEAACLESWDKEEMKAITTKIRTKSGRLIEKIVYVTKDEYDDIKAGRVDAKNVLKKYVTTADGEQIEGWGEAEMKTIKTMVRTKSGRLVEKTILVSKEDYDKLQALQAKGMSAEDAANAMGDILGKYMTMDDGAQLEGWKKTDSGPMKVIKTMVRTKSGRLVEKTILMTEDEYQQFLETGGDSKFLKKFLDLNPDDVIEEWEKGSTVYSASDDDIVQKTKPGQRFTGKDGAQYEIVVDPITGKKYKRKVDKAPGKRRPSINMKGKIGKGKILGAAAHHEDPNEKGMTEAQKLQYRTGKRREGSDSDFSYKSFVSDGGGRHVKRRRKRADGTYSDSESYHSSQDGDGKDRRQARRKTRKAAAVKQKLAKIAQGGRNADSDSDFSYKSYKSAGGTRHVRRKKKHADGGYSASESYHSSADEEGAKRRKGRRGEKLKAMKKGKRNADSDSDFSYKSYHSAGGTRHVRRKKKHADGTYSHSESFHSSEDEGGRTRRRKRRAERQAKYKAGKRNPGSDSDFSYKSFVSDGGTRHVKRKRKHKDGTYSGSESYHSSQDEGGAARRRRRRRDRKHVGSAHSYFSIVSAGGTRHIRRKKKRADGTYSSSESYHSGDSDFFDTGKKKKGGGKPVKVKIGKDGKRVRKVQHEHGSDSEYSYTSEVSVGGTRRRTRRQRIRDKHGRVVGHGKTESYSSPSEYETDSSDSEFELKSDGKGGFLKVKKKKAIRDPFGGSLASTDSENEPDLSKMTAKEKKKYLSDKAKRKAEREKKRKEKFGDKYEEMKEKHAKAKEAKKEAKSMVTYGKGGPRFKDGDSDSRGIGEGHNKWGKDGNEGDDESEEYMDSEGVIRRRKKKNDPKEDFEYVRDADGNLMFDADGKPILQLKKGGHDSDEESVYEYVRDKDGKVLRDKDGNPIRKKVGTLKKGGKGKKHGDGVIDSDSEFEYLHDDEGNVVRRKKKGKDGKKELLPHEEPDDGDYFETMADGTLRMKRGKKKIDISKLTDEDLRKLGIDPRNMTKEQIARILKDQFGNQIEIVRDGHRVGLKHADEFSDADTDDLANEEDLDISTLTGLKRLRVLLKRGGQPLQTHIKKVIEDSKLVDETHVHPEEKDASIDFLNHYKLVDEKKLDGYARAFCCEDEDFDAVIYPREARLALDCVPAVQAITPKQREYVLSVLNIDQETNMTFRMFSVMVALAERVTAMDKHCKHLLEISDIADIERKLELYKEMFYCNVPSDRNPNYIESDSLKIELIAGGLSWKQQQFVMDKFCPTEWGEISFLDYLVYIPLFMSMHDNMCDNPLDMSASKYEPRQPSAQRDQNPLGYPLSKDSAFLKRNGGQPPVPEVRKKETYRRAKNLLAGKDPEEADDDHVDLFKYSKLPEIAGIKK